MGEVYLCRSRSGQRLAVKSIRRELAEQDPSFLERFRHEVAAARQINGLYTAHVVAADADGSPPWLATAYIDAPSLEDRVREQGPLSPVEVRNLAAGLAEGLSEIHNAGLVHRDLKPANVLLASDGPRIIDFGLAKTAASESLTRSGTIVGTVSYMSPEQARGDRVGPATDVFSLGLVLHFAAAGRGVWGEGGNTQVLYRIAHEPPRFSEDLTEDLRSIVSRCLAKSPEERPTPVELLAEFGDRDLTEDSPPKDSPTIARQVPESRAGHDGFAEPDFRRGADGSAVHQDTATITGRMVFPDAPAPARRARRRPKRSPSRNGDDVLGIALAITFVLAVTAMAVIAWFINEWFAISLYSLTAIAVIYNLLRWIDW
jgi:serine/threonine protein kinase